jgi:hypothetical protein
MLAEATAADMAYARRTGDNLCPFASTRLGEDKAAARGWTATPTVRSLPLPRECRRAFPAANLVADTKALTRNPAAAMLPRMKLEPGNRRRHFCPTGTAAGQ